jgi:putative transposase
MRMRPWPTSSPNASAKLYLCGPGGYRHRESITADIIELARQYGRYGYRKIAELLRQAGWTINDKRVERIWQREGLKVPHKQPKRGTST